MLAQSALDYSWMDHVDTEHGVFITAEGLLMYLHPDEAMGLIAECANAFSRRADDVRPAAAVGRGLARRGTRASLRYRMPPMPFSLSARRPTILVNTVPGVRAVHHVQISAGPRHGAQHAESRRRNGSPLFDPVRPVWLVLEFG